EEVQEDSLDGVNNAMTIPLSQLRERVGEIPQDKPVVTLCRSGKRSAIALNILKEAGHSRVANIKGGILQWRAQH
ncbi:MAG TPA: rhodanese-like domain-containing protein, partial [Pseudomonadaceae bacterium]|nr:rhodanese-like domain-containing protein [Pseudomonadaceae bacterium]